MSPSVAAKSPESATDRGVRLAQVLEEYLAGLEAGTPVSRTGLLAKYPELAEDLEGCLASLEFIKRATATSQAGDREEGLPGKPLGDFCLLREIGRGGMGVVYEAEQVSLRRRVALKVLPFASVLDPRQLQRFKNEAQAAAALDHPNIVHIYSVGADRGVHYYAMQYIEGQTLAQVIQDLRARSELGHVTEGRPSLSQGTVAIPSGRATPPDVKPVDDRTESYAAGVQPPQAAQPAPAGAAPEEVDSPAADTTPLAQDAISTGGSTRSPGFFRAVAHFGIQAAEALDHAHQVGVVHRDVKPSNLMVSARTSPRPLSGRGAGGEGLHLWITDFGLATTRRDPSISMTGDVVGTLRYMSPEQILGDRRTLDHRTDIYSLGLTLYELITLRPVYASENRQEVVRQVVEDEPPPPRRFNAAIPRDLETIVLKAIAKEPQARYTTAQAFADDLRRFSTDQPIHAKRPGLRARLAHWARHHRSVVVAAVALWILAAIVAGIAALLVFQEQALTAAALEESRENLQVARQAVDDMYVRVAQSWLAEQPKLTPLQREFSEKAMQFYQRCVEREPDDEESRFETAIAWQRYAELQNKLEKYPEAELAIHEAIRRLEDLVRDEPTNREYCRALASALMDLGGTLLNTDVVRADSGAFPAYRRAFDLRKAIFEEEPSDHQSQLEYSEICLRLGVDLVLIGDFAEGEALLTQAVQHGRDLVRDNPEARSNVKVLTDALYGLADLRKQQNRFEESVRLYRETLPYSEAYLRLSPHSATDQRSIASSYRDLAIVLRRLGDDKEAESLLRRAVAIDEKVVADFPDVALFKKELGLDLWQLGLLLSHRGDRGAARTNFECAVAGFRGGFAQNPADLYGGLFLIESQQDLVDLLDHLGEHSEMRKARAQEIEDLQRVLQVHPGKAGLAGTCGESAYDLVDDPSPKHRDPDRAIAIAKTAIELSPNEGAGLDVLGIVHYRAGNWETAKQSLHRAVELSGQTPSIRRSRRYAVRRLPRAALYLAMAYAKVGDFDQARSWEAKAREFEIEATNHPNYTVPADLERLSEETISLLSQ